MCLFISMYICVHTDIHAYIHINMLTYICDLDVGKLVLSDSALGRDLLLVCGARGVRSCAKCM